MSPVEGTAAVSDHPGDEQLRQAFQALAENRSGECTPQDLDLIWRAVSGELPAPQRRELVDRVARDPACAEAWRVARELWQAAEGAPELAVRNDRVRSWSPSWLAAAAVVLLAVGAGLVIRFTSDPAGELRDGGDVVVESLVAPETTLPREAFALRWTGGPPGSRYQVRVTTEDLEVLASVADLTAAEFVVPAERFATVRPGTRVLWQVDVALPDGQTVSSGTFVARVD
jgi:hypothetical protein